MAEAERRDADQGITACRGERLVEMAGVIEITGERLRAMARHRAGGFRAPGQRQGLVPAKCRFAEHVAAEKAAAADD